jgi:hypothetical protein
VRALLYNDGTKQISLIQLGDAYGNPDFLSSDDNKDDSEEKQALNAHLDCLQTSNSVEDHGEFSGDDAEEDFELPDIQIPGTAAHIPTIINHESLENYRKKGPFGKLYNIGVLFRRSSQLKQAFLKAQKEMIPHQTPRAWVHNVATRWSSDFAMAERTLELQPALSKLFANIHQAWVTEGSMLAQRLEILNYKLTTPEWRMVAVLKRILKQFAISSKQLQENPASTYTRSTYGRFNEYFPVIEVLLDLLKRAVEGHIIEICPKTGQLVQNQLFKGISFAILSTFSASNVFLRYQQANSLAIKGSFKAGMLRAGSRRQASLRKTDAVGVRENPSSGPAKTGQPLKEWIRIHSSRLFPSRSTRSCSCFSFSSY